MYVEDTHKMSNSSGADSVITVETDDGPVYSSVLAFSVRPSLWQQLFQVHLKMMHPGRAPGKKLDATGLRNHERTWNKHKTYKFTQKWTLCGTTKVPNGTIYGPGPDIVQARRRRRLDETYLSRGCKAVEGLAGWRSASHESKVTCRAGRSWCDPIVMWSVDKVLDGAKYSFIAEVEVCQ